MSRDEPKYKQLKAREGKRRTIAPVPFRLRIDLRRYYPRIRSKELDRLEKYLDKNTYTYIRRQLFDGEQIIVFEEDRRIWDAICHSFSYGHEEGKLEIMGSIAKNEDVEGSLTARDIIERLEAKHER